MAKALETGSSHPLAKAISEHDSDLAGNLAFNEIKAMEIKVLSGNGISGIIAGRSVFLGNPRAATCLVAIDENIASQIAMLEGSGRCVIVMVETQPTAYIIGIIALQDTQKADAKAGIDALTHLGIKSIMLTGDNDRAGQAVAASLGIKAYCELRPEDKAEIIGKMRLEGHIALVGDGINDAPALALANIGIAMAAGTDIAIETADAVLLHSRVMGVAQLITLSRATMRNIRYNITIALGLKLVFIMTSIIGLTGMWIAVLADTGATVIVTANALRLLSLRYK